MRRQGFHRLVSRLVAIVAGATLAGHALAAAVLAAANAAPAVAEAELAHVALVAVEAVHTAADKQLAAVFTLQDLKTVFSTVFRPISGLQPNKYGRYQLLFL